MYWAGPCLWRDQDNWEPHSWSCDPNCYPKTSADDGTIPVPETTTVVDLGNTDITIDDLSVSSTVPRTVRFVGDATLKVETLVITGPATGVIPNVVEFHDETELEAK